MRITGGNFRGRVLKVPAGEAVRPTQDRVREALFNIIRNEVAGARFLDLCAGCGSVGAEALSRGAAFALLVEKDRRHAACLRANLQMFPAGTWQVTETDAWNWAAQTERHASAQGFDIAFCDPPYALAAEKGYGGLLQMLAQNGVVKAGGLFVAEMAHGQTPDVSPLWDLCRDRIYGQTRLAIYKRIMI